MCSEPDSRPPAPPGDVASTGTAHAERVTLASADGTTFSAAIAVAPQPRSDVGVVILPDVRGLYRFYEELAERLAEAGHHAVVVDYFGRTAGLGPRDDDFEFWPHTIAVEIETAHADIAASIDALRERTGATSFVAIGFC